MIHAKRLASEPTILAIETATSMCSAALLRGGEITQQVESGNNIHSRVLLDMVHALLQDASITAAALDAVAVGQGPGSFTGLRIGVGVGQGIAYGAHCPMIGVSSLHALAQAALALNLLAPCDTVLAGIDARMGEVYWAEFEREGDVLLLQGDMQVCVPENIAVGAKSFALVGNAWPEYWADFEAGIHLKGRLLKEVGCPEAQHILALAAAKYVDGDTVDAVQFAPNYVRDDVAKKSTKPLPGKRI